MTRPWGDWECAWDRARAAAYYNSPEYDEYIFAPYRRSSTHNTPSVFSPDPKDVILSKEPGKYTTRCPAHDDVGPSLGVLIKEDGKVLVNCLAGCETWRVLEELGLQWADLMA
jgi:hypothetical protein